MKEPRECHFRDLKRLGRYLHHHPRVVQYFNQQEERTVELCATVDSDHAGCLLTRRSTTGEAVWFGGHCLGHSARVQSTISLNVAESEYYALVKGAARVLMMRSLFLDWDIDVPAVIKSDSSSANSLANRRGLGRQRHVQTRYLWIQERIACRHIVVRYIKGILNPADLLTKPLPESRIRELAEIFQQEIFALARGG